MTFTAAHRKLLDAMLDKAPWPHRAGVYSIDEEEAEAIRALLQAYTMVSEERDRINDVLTKVYAERDELAVYKAACLATHYPIIVENVRLKDDIAVLGECVTAQVAKCKHLAERVKVLEDALQDIFTMLDDGYLVRDTSHDGQDGWAMRQLPYVRKLAAAQAALSAPATQSEGK